MDDFLGASHDSSGVAASGMKEDKGTESDPIAVGPDSGPPSWSLPIQHLSASSLNMLAICPRQFQQRYILGRKDAPTQAQIVGNSVHTAVEYNYRQKQVSHEDLPVEDVMEFYNDQAFDTAVEEAGGETEIKWYTQKDAKLTGATMVLAYQKGVAATVQPVEVEYQFSVAVPNVPVPIVGRIDVIDAETIIDLKTSKRKVSKMKPGWRNQGRVYQLVTPRHAAFHVVTNKGENLEGDFEIRYSHLAWLETERWVAQLSGLANYFWHTYGPDVDWPTIGTAHDWRCDWCAYRKGCPAWRV